MTFPEAARTLIRIAIVLLWGSCASSGATVIGLDAATTEVPLASFLSCYRDASGQMTLAQVQQEWERGRFSPGTQRRLSLGFTPDAIWLRFAMRHQGDYPATWMVELQTPRMDAVDAYLVHGSRPVEHFAAGNLQTASVELVDAINPTFPVSLQPGEEVECFLRVSSETSLQLPLRLWGIRQYANSKAGDWFFTTGFFGYLTALILLGFVFGIISRERGMTIYALSLVGVFACYFILSGYWVWLGFPARAVVVKQGVILAGEFALFMMLAFVRRLLELDSVMPQTDRWVARVMWAGLAATPVLFSLPYRTSYPLFVGHLLLVGVALMLIAFVAWQRRVRVARFYSIAWIVFWASYGVSSIQFLAQHPMPHLPWVYSLLGVAGSATLFLFAIADRVREIRQAAQKAQAQVLAAERQISEELRLQMRREQLLIRDLHDGIGGLNASLAILGEVGRREATSEMDRERFARISKLASDGGDEVRSLMSSLEAGEMSWLDFLDECRRCAQLMLPPHGIEFTVMETGYSGQPGPGVFPGMSLLRVFKETLTNAVKHSGCTRVTVLAAFAPRQLRLTIRDNGRGMAPNLSQGRGLKNMALRIRELGGQITCQSSAGVEWVFELPLPIALGDSTMTSPI